MKAYYFRLMDGKEYTGYSGMVVGQNMIDIFWQIDEYCNPHYCQIREASFGGYCRKDNKNNEDFETSEYEFSDYHPLHDESEQWYVCDWDKLFSKTFAKALT